MHKKKIAFVIGSLSSGGAERVISNLSNGLIDRFDIVIITFVNSKPFYSLDDRIKVLSCLKFINQSTSTYQSIKLNYILTKKIYHIIKAEQVNIVIGFITSANILSTIAAKMYGIPCIISERNNPIHNDLSSFWVILKNFIYPLADRIVLQTQGVKKIFEKKIKADKLIILPNPISLELTNKRDESTKKENLIITVGTLNENKNQKDIIAAFASIDIENWKLIIIGDGNKKEELNDLIQVANLKDGVEIISKVKDIYKYYNKASIFIFTSKTEGFPNALLEAMHFGLPCISTDCDFGPSELIDDGINGYLVPINNYVILREKLTQLMKNEVLRGEFSKKAKSSTDNFQSTEVMAKWEDLINSLI
ncbi:glycosyltransferase family 4 protein [Gelidibacter sp.]|uniref:glycosyltransferase family 4 protein n=1 Tax=Gelidibacter sp. TaxID=2018083 RepID=UPI003266AF26